MSLLTNTDGEQLNKNLSNKNHKIINSDFFLTICTDEEIKKPEKKSEEGGVVYDSATLKLSVKDKISKFKGGRNETEAGKGKPLLQPEKKETVVKQSNSEDNINSQPLSQASPDGEKFSLF